MWEVMKINMDINGLNGKSGGRVLFTGPELNRLSGNSKFRKKRRINRALNQKRMALFITGSNCRTACISTGIVILGAQ